MALKQKRKAEEQTKDLKEISSTTPEKKAKKKKADKNVNIKPSLEKSVKNKKDKKLNKDSSNDNKLKKSPNEVNKDVKLNKSKSKKDGEKPKKPFGTNKFSKKFNPNSAKPSKPADWNEFKKKKKELRLKRRQNKPLSDSVSIPKQLGEKIRMKKLTPEERNKMIEKVHNQVKGKNLYQKFVLTHDMARVVQILLKYGPNEIREEIIKELNPITMQMIDSKYGKFCVKRMLKYSTAELRSQTIKAMYGNAVKLSSHAISAPIFEYAYSTWATPQEKQHFAQEFFGDMYKNTKDNKIKNLRDVFDKDPEMKTAILGATKLNLERILNKTLLDSQLVQTVLSQYLIECNSNDRTELIGQLSGHVVILSNSKDGARVVMQCIWHGSNKDRKVAMKALKEHVLELAKHEHGHSALIALLDAADDTVLLNKLIISELIKNCVDLSKDNVGRKVLLWMVAPADHSQFHPKFIKELEEGRENSTCKKPTDIRRKEILDYSSEGLLKSIALDAKHWLESGPIGLLTLSILKTGSGEALQMALVEISKVITDESWKIKVQDKEGEKEELGIENAGLHMILKKLAQNDKILLEKDMQLTFGRFLLDEFEKTAVEVLSNWLKLNRACFLLVAVYENGSEDTQSRLVGLLKGHKKLLKKQESTGAKILCKKLTV